jgi:hypothetical protein
MSTTLDSEEHFKERVLQIGFTAANLVILEAAGWTTLGRFAFSCSQAPGTSASEQAFVDQVLTPLWGAPCPPGTMALTRRLFFEAYTSAASEMRLRLERNDDDPPRRMPRAERETRIAATKLRLPGIEFGTEREPAPSVVDYFATVADEGILKYLEWSRTVSAKFENENGKTCSEWKPHPVTRVITERLSRAAPSQEIGHDLLRLEHVFTRRALAMEAARLLPVEAHQAASVKFFEAMEDSPADPTRYEKASLAQVAKADRELFAIVSKAAARGSITKTAGGIYPLEAVWRVSLLSARIEQILAPLPTSHAAKSGSSTTAHVAPTNSGESAAVKKLTTLVEGLQKRLKDQSGVIDPKLKKKGDRTKGDGKKKEAYKVMMPKGLIGCKSKNAEEENLCFGFNLPGGCPSGKAPGEKCPKGWHQCCKCLKNHSKQACTES